MRRSRRSFSGPVAGRFRKGRMLRQTPSHRKPTVLLVEVISMYFSLLPRNAHLALLCASARERDASQAEGFHPQRGAR